MLTTLKPGLYLGIDGGGTKTEAVVATESGYVLGRGTAGGANPHNVPVDVAIQNIKLSVDLARMDVLKNRPEVNPRQFEAACLGLAGIDTLADRKKITDYFESIPYHQWPINAQKLILCNDGFIGLKSGTDENWGVCLIASTGNNCYGVNQLGREAAAGDWGYLLGDEGSGFSMGSQLVRTVIREYDGRLPHSLLSKKVLDHLGLKSVTDLIPWAYGGQVPVKDIASLSQLLNDSDVADMLVVQAIVHKVTVSLVESYEAVVATLELNQKQTFSVVLVGGLYNLKNNFLNHIRRAIMDRTPKARILMPKRSSAEGAIQVAQMANLRKLFPESVVTFIGPDTLPTS